MNTVYIQKLKLGDGDKCNIPAFLFFNLVTKLLFSNGVSAQGCTEHWLRGWKKVQNKFCAFQFRQYVAPPTHCVISQPSPKMAFITPPSSTSAVCNNDTLEIKRIECDTASDSSLGRGGWRIYCASHKTSITDQNRRSPLSLVLATVTAFSRHLPAFCSRDVMNTHVDVTKHTFRLLPAQTCLCSAEQAKSDTSMFCLSYAEWNESSELDVGVSDVCVPPLLLHEFSYFARSWDIIQISFRIKKSMQRW